MIQSYGLSKVMNRAWPQRVRINEVPLYMVGQNKMSLLGLGLPSALKPGRVIRVTFSPGHPGLTRFTIYPGLTRIGSREKRNCLFDDVETSKRYRVALS